MKFRTVLILALFYLAACACRAEESSDGKDGFLLLISLGGFPASDLLDPTVPAPTLRRLASEGATASHMTSVNPTVTWPDHAALVTGVRPEKSGVLYNGIVVRGRPNTPVQTRPCSRAEILQAPTFYDLAHQAGLTTAQVGWPPCDTGPTITWGIGEMANAKGAIEGEMMQKGLLSESDLAELPRTSSPRRDAIWFRAVTNIITQHHPQVLLLRLTDFDAITHKFGPESEQSRAAVSAADTRVNQILTVLKENGLLDRATVFIVSDQGFKPIHRDIRPNAALLKAGLLTTAGPKVMPIVVSADAFALTGGGIAQLFVTSPDHRDEIRARVKQIFSGMEGVDQVLEPSGYAAAGFPNFTENGQMGDLVLLAKPGYGFIATPGGEVVSDVVKGTTVAFHGYLASDPDMDAIFIAWGRHIRPGVHLDRVSNVDVAPTIAQVLGLKMENVDGKVLREILQ